MQITKTQIKEVLYWLAPTGIEIVAYLGLSAATLLASNIVRIQRVLSYPADLSLRLAVIGSLDNLLSQFLGDRVAATIATATFWSFIGVLVYILFWLIGNFSNEVSNDLTVTKYVHPENVNVYSPLKEFALRTLFQVVILIYTLFFLSVCVKVLIPLFVGNFSIITREGLSQHFLIGTLLSVAGEILMLHTIVVLTRLLTLRKRVFGNYQG